MPMTVKPGRWGLLPARLILLLLVAVILGACVYLRLYEFKVQLEEFDQHFATSSEEEFTLHFRDPMLYSEDFVSLAKLQPTGKQVTQARETWFYLFEQIDGAGRVIPDGVDLLFQMDFNEEDLLVDWHFSSLFLEMVPAEFLEASLRSLGSAEIDRSDRQVRAAAGSLPAIDSLLPARAHLEKILGEPITREQRLPVTVLLYRFQLDTPSIEEGYEDRRITEVKLYFDRTSDRLVRVKGRFAGLKLAIDYRKFGPSEED